MNTYDLEAASQRVVEDLLTLRSMTENEDGAQRVAWTAVWQQSRDWFKGLAEELGADVTMDSAGNVWTKIQGKSNEAVVIGSHLDSVPNGGWLDGALGVLAGLEAVRYYHRAGTVPAKTIYIVDWADEEGAGYGYSCLGSSAASGSLNIEELRNRTDYRGIKFEEAIKEYGLELNHMPAAHKEFKERNPIAYLELHIEQGPVLERKNKSVAAVTGAAGVERHYIDFIGQAAHAGSFPVKDRRDAFLAAAETALAVRELALKYDAMCTVGQISVEPDVVTIVPGKASISLDQRTINSDDLEAVYQAAIAVSETSANNHQVEVHWRKIYSTPPQHFDAELVKLCQAAVAEEIGEAVTMYSGPLHDAVEMAKVLPTVMMFVMSKDGLSHTKEEDTPLNELKEGIRAFLRLINKTVNS